MPTDLSPDLKAQARKLMKQLEDSVFTADDMPVLLQEFILPILESALLAAERRGAQQALREAYAAVTDEHLDDPQDGTSDEAYENAITDAQLAIDKLMIRERASSADQPPAKEP